MPSYQTSGRCKRLYRSKDLRQVEARIPRIEGRVLDALTIIKVLTIVEAALSFIHK